jgi:invasion protein IalB
LSKDQAPQKAPEPETTTTVVGDWRVFEQTTPDGTVRKFMNQRGVDGENKKILYQIGFQYNAAKKEIITELLVPLGVRLTEEISFGIDDKNNTTATYQSCFSEGCLAVVKVDKKLEKKLAENEKGYIGFNHTQGGNVKFPFSLKGFAQGMEKLKKD